MKNLNIKQLSDLIIDQANKKGFGGKLEEINVPEKFALIHSEVSEAFEAYRHKKIEGKDGLAMEMGDIVQRVLHLSVILNIDIQKAILDKMEINKDRDWDWKKIQEKHT